LFLIRLNFAFFLVVQLILYISQSIFSTMTQTIGMKLDALISNLDSLSSTQLYAVIVAITVVISFSLLGGASSGDVTPPPSPLAAKPRAPQKGPQPKWFVLKWLNYIAGSAFVTSVIHFSWHAPHYLHNTSSLLQFLVGWSLFLCYFFGFFGISFVDTDELGAMAAR
jgi:hypothetical protein